VCFRIALLLMTVEWTRGTHWGLGKIGIEHEMKMKGKHPHRESGAMSANHPF
jgi:hypothetical protein